MLADTRSLALASALCAALFVSSCENRADERTLASARVAPALPAPIGLAVELFVPRPLEFWPLLRPLLGPVGELLPRGPELALGSAIGLSPVAATALDLRSPLLGALRLDGARQGAVIGAHLVSGDEFVAALTTGNAPTHRVQNDGEVRVLVPLTGQAGSTALGVLDDTLLAGTRAELGALGPYVVRTQARKPMPQPDNAAILVMSGDALRSSLLPFLRAGWNSWRGVLEQTLSLAQSEQGRAADLADPRAVLKGIDTSAEAVFSALASARKLEARLIPEANRLLLDVEFSARSTVASTLANVPLEALFAAPEDMLARVSLGRSAIAPPAELGAELRALFGPRLTEKDYARVEEAVTLVEQGRGRAQAFAGRADGAFVWIGDVADPKKLEDGLQKSLLLLQSRSVVAPLASIVGALRVRAMRRRVRGLESPARGATIELSASDGTANRARGPARRLELVWIVRDRDFAVVLAPDAVPLLESVLERRAKRADDGAAALLAPANTAAVAGLVELGGLPLFGKPGLGKTIGFAMTQSPDVFRLSVAASPTALAALTRMHL